MQMSSGRVGRVEVYGKLYAEAGATVDLFAAEPGRENAVGVIGGSGGGRSLIFNGHVDVVPVVSMRTGPTVRLLVDGSIGSYLGSGRL